MLTHLHSPARRKNREQGFTLIELLIVVIIIGILAAIALPIFLNQQKAANDASAVSDVRNTVDSVQTFLVAGNPSTAIANTGAYTTAGGKATISNGDTVGVNIGTDGSYQVCGYVTSGSGNQYKNAGAAYTYNSANGTFATAACTSGSDTGGSNGPAAAPSTTTIANYDFNDGTTQGFTARTSGFTVSNASIGGRQALKMVGTGSGYGQSPSITLTGGKSYTFSAYVYLVSGSDAYVGAIPYTNVQGSWQYITTTYNVTQTTTQTLNTWIDGTTGTSSSVAYYDDIKVVQNN